MAGAGYFLYPSLESFTAPTHRATVEVQEPQASLPPAVPVERETAEPPKKAKPAPTPKPRKPANTPAKTTVAARPIRQISPSAPEGIRNRIRGEVSVDVRLHIAPTGSVVGAKLMNFSHDGVESFLGQRALQAVRQWKFQPARVGDRPVPADRTVRFRFRKSGTQWSIIA